MTVILFVSSGQKVRTLDAVALTHANQCFCVCSSTSHPSRPHPKPLVLPTPPMKILHSRGIKSWMTPTYDPPTSRFTNKSGSKRKPRAMIHTRQFKIVPSGQWSVSQKALTIRCTRNLGQAVARFAAYEAIPLTLGLPSKVNTPSRSTHRTTRR